MKRLCAVQSGGYAYTRVVGTGGIGSGMFFLLEQQHTLGRNESRLGDLLPFKDYCKQHIILHYIATLLGAGTGEPIGVYPIGKVGDDVTGRALVDQMQSAGMDVAHIHTVSDASTLFSVCFQYPDKSGGNITTGNSASALVKAGDIDTYFAKIAGIGSEILLAAPEVPVATRIRLLEYGRTRGGLNVSSLLSGEVEEFKEKGGFALTDILAINIDEAENIAVLTVDETSKMEVIEECIRTLRDENPGIAVLITNGSDGVYSYTGGAIVRHPGYQVNAVSTAGAGDAFLSGTICGLCCGLPLHTEAGYPDELHAVALGNLLAAFSVTSPDTIHLSADIGSLRAFAENIGEGERFAPLFDTE